MVLLLNQLPEEACFRLAATEDWSFTKRLMAAEINELRIMRAENTVLNGGEFREPQLIKTPAEQLNEQVSSEQKKAIRTGIMAQLNQGV